MGYKTAPDGSLGLLHGLLMVFISACYINFERLIVLLG